MARPIKYKNEDIVQSYVQTTARYQMTVQEKRILYQIIKAAQKARKGVRLKDYVGHQLPHHLYGQVVEIKISDILIGEDNQNYTAAIKALSSFQKKTIEYEDQNVWRSSVILSDIVMFKREGYAELKVNDFVWDKLLDMAKGYSEYELNVAQSLQSTYSMRMYEFIASQKMAFDRPIPIDVIKKALGIENKYKLFGDFKKRVLDVAKKELDEKSPKTFNYRVAKSGRKIIGLWFDPIYQPDKEDPEIAAVKFRPQLSASRLVSDDVYRILTQQFGFKAQQLNVNKKTLQDGQTYIPDFYGWLSNRLATYRKGEHGIGWLINAVKQATLEAREGKPQTPTEAKNAAKLNDISAKIAKQLSIFGDSK